MTDSNFWSPNNTAKASAMRAYRALLRGLNPHDQWRCECLVYTLRGQGRPECEIRKLLTAGLERVHPWRMSDSRLKHAWFAVKKRTGRTRTRPDR